MKYNSNITLKNGDTCILRNATKEDAEFLLNFFEKVCVETDFLLSSPDEVFSIEDEREFLEKKEKSLYEIEICSIVNGKIVGLAGLSSIGKKEKIRHRATLGLSVENEFWGLGIGYALSKACIDCAKSAGYKQLELEVVSENKKALNLYKKIGFEEYGRNPKGLYSHYSGWQELVLMRLQLD